MSTHWKPLDQLTIEDLKQMVESDMKEDQYHEFKREMPHPDSFCAAISSLANTHGGDFFLGIDAPEGSRAVLNGIETVDADKELLRYMNILQNGVEPKLPQMKTKIFEIEENKFIFLFRISRSWIRPHRVIKSSKFYARKSNGKFEIDVYELRQMFAESGTFANKFKEFREERVLHHMLGSNDHPFTLIHLVPISCFENRFSLDLSIGSRLELKTIGSYGGYNPRVNFNGIYSADRYNESSVQIFRNGIIEGATKNLTVEQSIPAVFVVQELIEFLKNQTNNYKIMGMDEPFYVSVSMFGVNGHKFVLPANYILAGTRILNEDKLIFPEILIEDRDSIEEKITPIFDALWNAFGFIGYKGV